MNRALRCLMLQPKHRFDLIVGLVDGAHATNFFIALATQFESRFCECGFVGPASDRSRHHRIHI